MRRARRSPPFTPKTGEAIDQERIDQARTHGPRTKGEARMSDDDTALDAFGPKVTRRRLIGYGAATAGALGATMLVPAPWRAAFGQAKPYKIGSLQPLS